MPVRSIASVGEVQRSLGLRIRGLRSRKGWSQEQFAEICGLHRTYMGHVERGEKNVSLSTVVRVSDALGIRLSKLFAGAEKGEGRIQDLRRNPGRRAGSALRTGRRGVDIDRLLGELQIERKALRQAVRALTQLPRGPGRKQKG